VITFVLNMTDANGVAYAVCAITGNAMPVLDGADPVDMAELSARGPITVTRVRAVETKIDVSIIEDETKEHSREP
jgi:hypothetical protein